VFVGLRLSTDLGKRSGGFDGGVFMVKPKDHESDAVRDATLKKMLSTPPKPKDKPTPKKKRKKAT